MKHARVMITVLRVAGFVLFIGGPAASFALLANPTPRYQSDDTLAQLVAQAASRNPDPALLIACGVASMALALLLFAASALLDGMSTLCERSEPRP